MSFDPSGRFFLNSSDSGTIHIYALKYTEEENKRFKNRYD